MICYGVNLFWFFFFEILSTSGIIDVYCQIWKVFRHYSLECFFNSTLFLLSWDSNSTYIFRCFPQTSEVLFSLFSLSCLESIFCHMLLLMSPFNKFLVLVILFFNTFLLALFYSFDLYFLFFLVVSRQFVIDCLSISWKLFSIPCQIILTSHSSWRWHQLIEILVFLYLTLILLSLYISLGIFGYGVKRLSIVFKLVI